MPDIECFLIEERNRRPNPHLAQDIADRGGGAVEVVDWHRVDTGEVLAAGVHGSWPMTGRAPVGAMYFFDNPDPISSYRPHPGPNLFVNVPGGHGWCIDSRASNCSRPEDNEHHCWVRHGDPPNVTVDKNGETCAAGAGSIQTGDWHGFLRDGRLVVC